MDPPGANGAAKLGVRVLSFLLLAVSASFARIPVDNELEEGWENPLGPRSSVRAHDVALRIFPGASLVSHDLVLVRAKELRQIDTRDERTELPEGTRLFPPRLMPVQGQGKAWTLLLSEGERGDEQSSGGFASGVAVLMVLPSGEAEPTDVVELKTDRFTSFGAIDLPAAGDDDLFTIENTHANAGEPFAITGLYHIREGRVRRILEVAYVSSLEGCAAAFAESLRIEGEPDPERGRPKLVVTVRVTTAPREWMADCEEPIPDPATIEFADVYRWDVVRARYLRASGNLDGLNRWNEEHQ